RTGEGDHAGVPFPLVGLFGCQVAGTYNPMLWWAPQLEHRRYFRKRPSAGERRTTTAVIAAAQTRAGDSNCPSVRAMAIQASPHAVASAGATRPPSRKAAVTATAPATMKPAMATGISSMNSSPA